MSRITIAAPAKLNLHLRIDGRRPDGFHSIESLFLAVAFGDTLLFETTDKPASLEMVMDWRVPTSVDSSTSVATPIPPEKNIVSRAVSLFRERTGYASGLKVTIEKHIPLGGGLGGGSSNAAAALLALNRLAADDSSGPAGPAGEAVLAEMGALLGSDVPFFMSKSPAAWVSGRGEAVEPLILPDSVRGLHFVLVNPGFSSETAGAFRLLDAYRQDKAVSGSFSAGQPPDSALLRRSFAGPPRNWPFVNDFLPVFTAQAGADAVLGGTQPIYRRIISVLKEFGAEFAGLSGSGSTCFGVFIDQNKAEFAKNSIFKRYHLVIRTSPTCI